MAEPRLPSGPATPAASHEAVSAPRDAKGEFLAIMRGESTPGTAEATAKIESALASAPSDAARTAMQAEMRANAAALRGCMQMEDDVGLVALVEKILAEASRTNVASEAQSGIHKPQQQVSQVSSWVPLGLDKKEVWSEHLDEKTRTLIAQFGSPERLAKSEKFDRVEAEAIAKEPDAAKRERGMMRLQAKVILQDAEVQKEARANFKSDADFNRSLQSLQAMFPDIPAIVPPGPPNPPPSKYETELMRRAGAKADIPPTQVGNRITFATNQTDANGYVKMTMDVSHEPPTVLRHGPGGTLVPVNLDGNKSFDRAYGLMRATETLSAELENLKSRRDQLLANAEKIGDSLGVKTDRTQTPLNMLDNIIEQAEAKLTQDKQGTPPKEGALDSALAGALEGGDVAAMAGAEAPTPADMMKGAERFMTELKAIRKEVAKLEDDIRIKEDEKLRVDIAKAIADEEFARHLNEADANAQANMKSLGDSGADFLGQEGVMKLVELLNR